MDILKRLNTASAYIEAHLCGEPDMAELARITLCTPDGFARFFSYITGMTVIEYIRRRRLTLAAYELRGKDIKVIDVAVKYGWESADAFSRAFTRQHGITPSQARLTGSRLRAYPPISFQISITGGIGLEFEIAELKGLSLRGLSKRFTGAAAERFEQEHIMWGSSPDCDDAASRVHSQIPGVWYGIWDGGVYSVAREDANGAELEEIAVPPELYAKFYTEPGGFAGDELPCLRSQIQAWLADSGFTQTRDYEVEVYHLYSKAEKHLRHYELWVPVKRK